MDIQALRGIAVLLVLLYHTQLSFQTAGYLGVDVFFVISGFLITSIIRNDLASGQFSFRKFYSRRLRRIMPASLVVIALSFAVSGFFLTSGIQKNFNETAIASIFFVSNISLWLQSGYFSSDSALQPLLHMWSLSIEEQFYLFLPLLLFLIPLRRHFILVCLALVLSLVLCLAFVSTKTSATFYLLPTRAWSLLLGAACSIALGGQNAPKTDRPLLGFMGFAILIAVPIFAPGKQFGWPHPSVDSVLACCAVVLILVFRCPLLDTGGMAKVLGWFGNISYSLYLVHWPIVAFLNNAYMSEMPPVWIRVAIAIVSIGASLLLFATVEKPLRYASGKRLRTQGIAVLCTVLACVGLGKLATLGADTDGDFAHRLRPNTGLSDGCEHVDRFVQNRECTTGERPDTLVWGDSYAMHLVPAFLSNSEVVLAQATKSVCGPFHGIAPKHSDYLRGTQFIQDCFDFNQSVIDYVRDHPSLEVVVLSSLLNQYFFLDVQDADGNEVVLKPEDLALEIESTVELIRAAGPKAVLFAPTPSEGAGFNPHSGFDIGLCLERGMSGLIVAGKDSNCAIDESVYRAQEALSLSVLDLLEQRGNVPVLRFDNFLCAQGECAAREDDVLIYRDKGHLSYEGSQRLGAKYDLLGQARELAR